MALWEVRRWSQASFWEVDVAGGVRLAVFLQFSFMILVRTIGPVTGNILVSINPYIPDQTGGCPFVGTLL